MTPTARPTDADVREMAASAVISDCGLYRYRLERQCKGAGKTAIIMINPSTADASKDDATIRKLRGFGDRKQWGRIVIGNLFAFRSTDVKALAVADDPRGPENSDWLRSIMLDADRVIFAWGPASKLPKRLRAQWREVDHMARILGHDPQSIGKPAKDGHPCHPLMLAYELELQPWRPAL